MEYFLYFIIIFWLFMVIFYREKRLLVVKNHYYEAFFETDSMAVSPLYSEIIIKPKGKAGYFDKRTSTGGYCISAGGY